MTDNIVNIPENLAVFLVVIMVAAAIWIIAHGLFDYDGASTASEDYADGYTDGLSGRVANNISIDYVYGYTDGLSDRVVKEKSTIIKTKIESGAIIILICAITVYMWVKIRDAIR